MAAICDQRNPLRRSGTHQDGRAAVALDPDSAPIDERSLADLLVFAQRYSRHLKFYDAANNEDGDWLPFFGKDISAILALLQRLPNASFLEFSRNLRDWLVEDSGRAVPELQSHFKLLFHLPLLLLQEVGEHYDRLPIGHPLRLFVVKAVERDVATPLRELIAFAKGVRPPANDLELFADTPPDVVDYNTTFNDADSRIQLPGVVTQRLDGATSLADLPVSADVLAGIDPAGWSSLFASVDADGKPYADNNVYRDIADALQYGAFTKTFERIFQAIERIALQAGTALQASLEFDDHTPHYGLWLAFLQLFENNQTHLNTLTGRHLDFYYKDVLQLVPRGAEADQVHLLFELNKNVDDHLLAKDARFKAGKDDEGNAVAYALDSDFVVNRATVAELRSLYRSAVDLGDTEGVLPIASTVANSRDGIGEALSDEAPGWPPFGPAEAPPARVGFAIVDRKLFLREATRTITVCATLEGSTTSPSFSNAFRAHLTGEEGWLDVSDVLSVERSGSKLNFEIVLDGEAPAIVPYDAELHGDEFSVAEPVLKIEFAFDAEDTTATAGYTELRDLNITSIDLLVDVSGARNFSLQNDFGAIDTAKPFLPFGPTPDIGAALIVGSCEAFSKPLSSFVLDVEWEEELTSSDFFLKKGPSQYEVSTRQLVAGVWESLDSDESLFDSGSTLRTISLSNLSEPSTSIAQTIDNELYSSTSRAGFVGLDLQLSFGHAEYTDEKTLALIAAANSTQWPPTDLRSYIQGAQRAMIALDWRDVDELVDTSGGTGTIYPYGNDGTLPYEPYTPKIMEMTLSYKSASEPPTSFFHLLPFGHTSAVTENGRLFPDLANDGELYIGVAHLAPPQRLTLLFQTIDGSANPLKNENTVVWEYLRGNEWVDFSGQDIDDKTSNLTTSGIVGIAVPEDADKEHDVLPSGLHWIRLSVASDADALNDLLSIDAQAASTTFTDQDNDPAFVATPLPAATISKLAISDAAVKKIVQPYESFGGRGEESDDAFYVRVSERLRHKDRASTMWDYERLVLEAFPSVYKVKCINHTELRRDLDNVILADNELKPGHVLVVPVPYVSADGPIDPLRPYADKKTLVAIDDYLRARMSPFVVLEVQNPKIEAVQVSFDVAFTAEIEDITFYQSELADAIVRYLTPWSYEEGAEISFGGKWYKSAIIDFVEEQSYVDYVKDFEMYHKADIEQSDLEWNRIDVEVLQATTGRSILVSHETHTILEVS